MFNVVNDRPYTCDTSRRDRNDFISSNAVPDSKQELVIFSFIFADVDWRVRKQAASHRAIGRFIVVADGNRRVGGSDKM